MWTLEYVWQIINCTRSASRCKSQSFLLKVWFLYYIWSSSVLPRKPLNSVKVSNLPSNLLKSICLKSEPIVHNLSLFATTNPQLFLFCAHALGNLLLQHSYSHVIFVFFPVKSHLGFNPLNTCSILWQQRKRFNTVHFAHRKLLRV